MGMYTRLTLDVYLNKDLPEKVVSALSIMSSIEDRKERLQALEIEHPLFECDRAVWMFRGDSAYFDDWHEPVFRRRMDKGNRYELSLDFNIKNYKNEIQKFLGWISPYIDDGVGNVGTYQYEEARKASSVVWNGKTLATAVDVVSESPRPDIVERLRSAAYGGCWVPVKLAVKAADEIEQLREQVDVLKRGVQHELDEGERLYDEREDARAEAERLRKELDETQAKSQGWQAQLQRRRAELDEAANEIERLRVELEEKTDDLESER